MMLPFSRKGLEEYLDEKLTCIQRRQADDVRDTISLQTAALTARLAAEINACINNLQQIVETQTSSKTEKLFTALKEEVNLQLHRRINDLQSAIEQQTSAQMANLFEQLKEETNLQFHRRINDLQNAAGAESKAQNDLLFVQIKEEMNLQLHQRINALQNVVNKDIRDMHGDLYGFFGRFPRMLSFEVPLADHCNLNCAGCSHFSPLAPPHFMDLDEFTRDFERMGELLGAYTRQIRLMGGEPLLNRNINQYLAAARKCFPQAEILIVTNGLLLPKMDDSFWKICKENEIVIAPTKYPVNFDYRKAEELTKSHEVKYRYFSDREVTKVFEKYALDPQGLQDREKNYRMCSIPNPCPCLRNGRLYLCPVPPTAHYLNESFGTQFQESPQDSIDIYQANSAEEVLEFLAKPIPFCRYCHRDIVIDNIPWTHSKRELSEWTL